MYFRPLHAFTSWILPRVDFDARTGFVAVAPNFSEMLSQSRSSLTDGRGGVQVMRVLDS